MQDKVRHQMDVMMNYITGKGLVPVQQLISELGLSKSTVSRYLNHLEQEGKVRRMYGGVSACISEELPVPAVPGDQQDSVRKRIGSRAAELVEDNDIIFVGTGRTCFELYRSLKGHDIVVFTNNIYCAAYQNPSVSHVYILGGEVFDGNVVLGSLGIENLSKINPGKIFFSASAINPRFEIQYKQDVERQYIETLMQMEGKKIFLVNRAKQDRQCPFKMDCLSMLDAFVTDIEMTAEREELFARLGTEVLSV